MSETTIDQQLALASLENKRGFFEVKVGGLVLKVNRLGTFATSDEAFVCRNGRPWISWSQRRRDVLDVLLRDR